MLVGERVAKVLLPKDWLRWQLTGEAVSEMSDAAGTLWLDTGRRDWSDDLLAATWILREPGSGTRQTFDRAIESMNAVNDEIAAIIQSTWGRNGKKA